MPKRMTRAELRTLLVDTGAELLIEDGMRCGLDQLTLPRVFARIEAGSGRRVTGASVYDRLWHSQEEYQWDVLAHVIGQASAIEERTHRRVRRILASSDITTEEGRLEGLRRLCQLAVEQHVIEAARRQHFRIVMAAVGGIASSERDAVDEPAHVTRVRESLNDYLARETDAYLELYHRIGAHLGLRMRHPLELRHLVLAVGAVGDGIAMRLNFFPEYAARIEVPGEDRSAGGVWSIAGLSVEAIALAMLELDPDWSPPTDG